MNAVLIREIEKLSDEGKNALMAFYNGTYYDLFKYVELVNSGSTIFFSKELKTHDFKSAIKYKRERFIRSVATARYQACFEIQNLPPGFRCPVEYFDDFLSMDLNGLSRPIIEEYRKKKREAYAILH